MTIVKVPSISAARLRPLGIHNDFEFTCQKDPKRRAPIVDYISDTGRGGRGQYWAVWMGGVNLYGDDPPYYLCGGGYFGSPRYVRKDFNVFSYRGATFAESKRKTLEAALAFASERFGFEDWARTPFGAYAPAEFVQARLAELREQLAAS